MEYLKDLLKKSSSVAIVESLVFAALGIILILKPYEIMAFIAYIIGAVFIATGVIKIINYVKDKGQSDLYNYELIYGIMAAIVGLFVIIYRESITHIFGIIIGIWIIYSSVVRFSSALKLKQVKGNIWIYSVAIAIVMFICGLYVALSSGAIIFQAVGGIMIAYAILDIIENIIFLNNMKKM